MQFDLIVIGTGTAAMGVAMRVRKAGWTVGIVDDKPFGGTCALRGCDPKKMLISGGEAIDADRRMRGHGVRGELSIHWPELIAFKRSFTDLIPAKHEAQYHKAGIETFHGTARFTGPNRIAVGETEIEARHFVIASGAAPVELGIPGEEHLIDNEVFLSMEELPRRIVLVGGGYQAAEFSMVAADAGAQVTVLQRAERILTKFEPELVGWLMESFAAAGIDVRTNTEVTAVEKMNGGFKVHIKSGTGAATVEADVVVHAAGRGPALERLDLKAANVEVRGGKLVLNEYLQSVSNPAVYAAGDAAEAGPPLTPVTAQDAKVVAVNLLRGNRRKPDYRAVPSVAFTLPPIAMVGMSEEEARKSGKRIRVKCERTSGWFTARRLAEKVYGYKTIVEEESGWILGAHIVGPHADEVINLFGLAIRHGLTADDLKQTIFAYPTGASDVGYML
jgi:glutathione reductase (NADPH)